MKYYKKVLQPNETVKYVGRLHWMVYRVAILCVLLAVVAASLALLYEAHGGDTGLPSFGPAICLFCFGVYLFIGPWINRVTTEIVVADKRAIHKVGVFSRRTQEMNITKVETVDVI